MAFRILHPLFYLLSRVPFPVLYVLSDACAFFLGRVLRYRRKVVEENLRHAFPEKSQNERKRIRDDFYRNFCDVFLESLKLLSISKEDLKKRAVLRNPELIDEMERATGGGIVTFGHLANWEWLGASLGLYIPFETIGVYRPLSNPFFDRLMLHLRSRLGNRMIPADRAYRDCLKNLSGNAYYGFLSDQNPARTESLHFTSFLGRLAPFQTGIAKIVCKTQCLYYFSAIRRVRRGQYEMVLKRFDLSHFDFNSPDAENELSRMHIRELENEIRMHPACWLWSHRRWKHRPGEKDVRF